MKTQILLIGGGNAATTPEAYLNYIEKRPLSLDSFRTATNWRNTLHTDLGDDYDVLIPFMPNNWNARYSEWEMWFERIIPLLNDEVVLIGHSLGAIFLVKYLSLTRFPKKILRLFLLAAPYVRPGEYPLGDFVLTRGFNRVREQVKEISIYHSEDDKLVPTTCVARYQKEFPQAKVQIFKNRGHLNDPHFPEILEDLRSLRR